MTRFLKVLFGFGMSSVYLMQAGACQITGHGFSILPNVPLSLGTLVT